MPWRVTWCVVFRGSILSQFPRYDGHDRARFDRLAALPADLGIEMATCAGLIMYPGSRRRIVDALTCTART